MSKELSKFSNDELSAELKRRRILKQQQKEEEIREIAIQLQNLVRDFKNVTDKDYKDV